LESGEEGTPEISIDDLVELLDLKLHLSGLHGGREVTWLGLVWPDGEALVSLVGGCELSNDR